MTYQGPTPAEGSRAWHRRIKPLGHPLLDDFGNFQHVCLKATLGVRETALQRDIGEYLQYGPELRIIEVFRGGTKSWNTAFWTDWMVLRNAVDTDGHPDINILAVSGTKDRADNFTEFTRELFEYVPELRPLVPSDPTRWSLTGFDVAGAIPAQVPTVGSRAIFGRMAGDRGDVIIGDDVELPQNAETQTQRDKVRRRVADFQSILKPGGEVVLLGTPHFEDSLYNHLANPEAEAGYHRRIWPIVVPSAEKLPSYHGDVAPYVTELGPPGTLVEPTRFDEKELERVRAAGRSVFAMQWMLDTTLADAERYPLKLRDLILTDLDLEVGPDRPVWSGDPRNTRGDVAAYGLQGDRWQGPAGFGGPQNGQASFTPYTGKVLAIDPSGRGDNETAWSLVASMGSFLYLLEHGADVRGYDQPVLARILDVLQRSKCKHVVYEENFGGGMFGSVLSGYLTQHGYPCTVEPVRHSQSKEARIIDTLEPVVNAHRLVVNTSCATEDPAGSKGTDTAHRYRLWHQFTRIERVRGALSADDRLDALAIAVAHWVGVMQTDHAAFTQARDDQERVRGVRKFLEKVRKQRGGSGRPRTMALSNAGFNYGRPTNPLQKVI